MSVYPVAPAGAERSVTLLVKSMLVPELSEQAELRLARIAAGAAVIVAGYFGIHPPGNFGRGAVGNSNVTVAFNVESLGKTMSRLEQLGARQVRPPRDEGFGPVASYLDPDGNTFEIVELNYEFGDEEE